MLRKKCTIKGSKNVFLVSVTLKMLVLLIFNRKHRYSSANFDFLIFLTKYKDPKQRKNQIQKWLIPQKVLSFYIE